MHFPKKFLALLRDECTLVLAGQVVDVSFGVVDLEAYYHGQLIEGAYRAVRCAECSTLGIVFVACSRGTVLSASNSF